MMHTFSRHIMITSVTSIHSANTAAVLSYTNTRVGMDKILSWWLMEMTIE